jgi:hypothetical protein
MRLMTQRACQWIMPHAYLSRLPALPCLFWRRAFYLVGWRAPVAAAGRFRRCWIIPSQLIDGDCA